MKRFITLSILVIAFQVGFSKTISLDVILDYFPEAKEKGCVVVIENKESIDTLSFEKNNFKIDLELCNTTNSIGFDKSMEFSFSLIAKSSIILPSESIFCSKFSAFISKTTSVIP